MDYNEYVSKIIDGVWHENYKGFKLRDFNLWIDDNSFVDAYLWIIKFLLFYKQVKQSKKLKNK